MADQDQVFVFWRYDQFPFALGAPARKSEVPGCWYVPSYQMNLPVYKALRKCGLEEGAGILRELKALEEQRRSAITAIDAGFLARAEELLPGVCQ